MAINLARGIDQDREPADPLSVFGQALATGTRLRDYEVTGLISEGEYSFVYLAWDHSLQRKVAVKEYAPFSLAARVDGSPSVAARSDRHLDTFKAGLKSFIHEARLLARFDHPSLVKVYRFWEENGTAYMVMPFYEGPTLKTALAELGHVPSETELRAWLKPVLNAVTVLHDGETWHQHIGPDSIMLTPIGPVLLGFAAAEHAIAALKHTPAVALKPGFAAIEQYGGIAETTRGPWTDLYALAAVVYAAITGDDPAPAADRLADDRLARLSSVAAGLYKPRFLAAIDAALAVQPERRPRDHLQFRALMGDIETPERLELGPRLDLMQEPFGGTSEHPREITVPDGPLSVPAGHLQASGPGSDRAKSAARVATTSLVSADGEPTAPSWRRLGQRSRAFGSRAAYSLVAVTCVLIGVAVLALDFYGRQGTRAAPAAPVAASAAAPTPLALAPADVTHNVPAATVPLVASTAAPPTGPAEATMIAVPVATAPGLVPSPPSPVEAPQARSIAASTAPDPEPPSTPAERQARCLEILQKASLEPISLADTAFFKRECK